MRVRFMAIGHVNNCASRHGMLIGIIDTCATAGANFFRSTSNCVTWIVINSVRERIIIMYIYIWVFLAETSQIEKSGSALDMCALFHCFCAHTLPQLKLVILDCVSWCANNILHWSRKPYLFNCVIKLDEWKDPARSQWLEIRVMKVDQVVLHDQVFQPILVAQSTFALFKCVTLDCDFATLV
jgi:hypothetical protein